MNEQFDSNIIESKEEKETIILKEFYEVRHPDKELE